MEAQHLMAIMQVVTHDFTAQILEWTSAVSINWIGWGVVGLYYLVSAFFIECGPRSQEWNLFKKNGILDWLTSWIWIVCSISLFLISLSALVEQVMPMSMLLFYYSLFTFYFAFLYALLDWHWTMIEDAGTKWVAEGRYLLLSLQAMINAPFTLAKPRHPVAKVLTTLQTLIGLVFVAVFVAKTVSSFGGSS